MGQRGPNRDQKRSALIIAAARLMYEGKLTQTAIAHQLGIGRTSLKRYLADSEYAREMARLRNLSKSNETAGLLADQKERLKVLNDLGMRSYALLKARAQDPRMKRIKGGDTGLLILEPKTIAGRGVMVVKHDSQPLKDLEATCRAIAEELGQLGSNADVDDVRGDYDFAEVMMVYREAVVRKVQGAAVQ